MIDDKRPTRLGRGLSALLGDDREPAPPGAATMLAGSHPVPIEHLHRNRFQPRRNFDPAQIEALAASIRAQGVLQPLLVRPHPERAGEYEILAGERRWRAAQAAQLTEVPVLVRDIANREALEIALVENVQRQDLNAVEEAHGYQRLITEFGHTQEEIARVTGKSRPHITNTLRLLNLPDEVLALVEEGKLSPGHVRPLIGHAGAIAIAQEAVRRDLSVRQVEARMRAGDKAVPPQGRVAAPESDVNLRALEQEFENLTGMKTQISGDGRRGTVVFSYSDLDQIDALRTRLRPH
jgi:ParB family transcriptional regulator, chromosome partitioning protein